MATEATQRKAASWLTGIRAATALGLLSALPLQAQVAGSVAAHRGDTVAQAMAVLAHPPAEARPMVRWWWFGTAVVKPEILHELEQMKADGIGGAELAFVYPEVVNDPAKGLINLPFLSAPMLDAVRYAQQQGRRLGLRIDVTLCSGWPYGGPNTPLAEAASRLRTAEVAVAANATSAAVPQLAEGESLIAAAVVDGPLTNVPRHGAAPAPSWKAARAKPASLRGGSASFAPAMEPRVALFFIASHTLQQVKRAAVGAEGYVLDPFSHAAVATHLAKVGAPLMSAFDSTPPYAIFSDSLEAYGADWTPTMLVEFHKRRGYDLTPHLPELVAGGSAEAERVRHDWGRTLTELVNENYLTQINDWATAHGTRFRSQTYGEPAVDFSSQHLAALPEGEGPQWRAFSTLRWASSANHVYGNDVTSGETFTWLHSPVFRAIPLDMKAEADIDFIMGENQIMFHGWPYSAPGVPEPGWSLYAAAALNDHNPWHPVMPAVTSYLTRVSAMMREGEPANQVAILLPTDDAWAGFAPGKVTVSGAMQKLVSPQLMSNILSAGYNIDYIDAEAIDNVGLGTHSIVVLPPTDRIPVATLRKLVKFAKAGGKVLAVGRAPSMDAEGSTDTEVTRLAQQLFPHVVPAPEKLGPVLLAAVEPNFHAEGQQPQIGSIRRQFADGDIYFVANTGNTPVDTLVRFASSAATGIAVDPATGVTLSPVQAHSSHLYLAPYESRLFFFSAAAAAPQGKSFDQHVTQRVADLSASWIVRFTGTGRTETERALTDWTADPTTLHYSGEAVYSRDFFLLTMPASQMYLRVQGGAPSDPVTPNSPEEHAALMANGVPNPLVTHTGPGMHAYYDPPVRAAALVFVNGQAAGALWHPPYRLDVTKLLKPGQNHIEIHVYNTALNAWSALPPYDYGPLKAKYGDRFQMQDLDKVKPIPSGLLGKVEIVTGEP
jgi:hypothetical protein